MSGVAYLTRDEGVRGTRNEGRGTRDEGRGTRERTKPRASAITLSARLDPPAIDALRAGRLTMAELDEPFRRMKKVIDERALVWSAS